MRRCWRRFEAWWCLSGSVDVCAGESLGWSAACLRWPADLLEWVVLAVVDSAAEGSVGLAAAVATRYCLGLGAAAAVATRCRPDSIQM